MLENEFSLLEMEKQMKLYAKKYFKEPRVAIDHMKEAFTVQELALFALLTNKAYEEKSDDYR